MSNVVDLRRVQYLRCVSPPGEAKALDLDLDVASPIVVWRAMAVEQVCNAVLLLDLAAQRARLLVARILDQQERQNLIGQIETVERQLQLARDMARRL
jgi:hypothetical protein